MKEVLKKVSDWITIVCPLIIMVGGALEGSGFITILGSGGAWFASFLGGLIFVASLLFNIVTGYYQKKPVA